MTLLHQSALNQVDHVLVLQLRSNGIHTSLMELGYCMEIHYSNDNHRYVRHFCSSILVPVEAEVDVDVDPEVDIQAKVDAEVVVPVHNVFNIKTDLHV